MSETLDNERDGRELSIMEAIEYAETPWEAVGVAGRLSLQHVVKFPITLGREVATIVRNGDVQAILSSSSRHLS